MLIAKGIVDSYSVSNILSHLRTKTLDKVSLIKKEKVFFVSREVS